MFQQKVKVSRVFVWLIGLLLPLSFALGGTCTVVIKPTNSGTVSWQTLYPTDGGVLSGSGGHFTFTMDQTYITLTFFPNAGGSIVKVMTNEGDDTSWVLSHSNMDSWYGPGENSKLVTVTFSGSTPVTPVSPTGNFPLTFPTNSTALTAITDLSGVYTGKTPTVRQRLYNVTVAQDESGKLMAMGTVDGILASGPARAAADSAELSYNNIGSVTTVNNEPTVKTKGSFTGTVDGQVASSSGSGQAPAEISNIGTTTTPTNGVSGTGSYVAKINGVPVHPLPPGNNQVIVVPTPADAASHIHKAWSISLSITNKVSAKTHKPYIGATGVLTRPDGDVIRYPEQIVKYSTKTGYALTLKGGSNTTAQVSDKKSTITIKGMTMTKTGSVWNPTAGKLSYQFLGQKGTGDLMDFLGQ